MIYLDACVVIYLVERTPRWFTRVGRAMTQARGALFGISPLVKMECLTGCMRRGDAVLEDAFNTQFETFELLSIPERVFLHAARLRAQTGLKTPDALHVACAQFHHCDALWTNDDRLTRASHGLARKVPG